MDRALAFSLCLSVCCAARTALHLAHIIIVNSHHSLWVDERVCTCYTNVRPGM